MNSRVHARTICAAALSLVLACRAAAQVQITEPAYAERLRGMWLGECIANWTGLRTEGLRNNPPFLTDADWGQTWLGQPLTYVTQSPWSADDDTDVEYVYVHLMHDQQRMFLSPLAIADGWTRHINRYIWVSNDAARQLIGRGVLPPATGLGTANINRLMIDAQLTTEVFGALAPGSPALALAAGDLPIRTTSAGYATHAAQFYCALYALAPQVDPALTPREKNIWLVQHARAYIPNTSKSADVIDTVLADYLANPDVNNWERTRDLIAQRYQSDGPSHGFHYRVWYESSVNLATGCMALLYGEGNLPRTIQIGTLSGWDSDNGTATMGGLLGLMNGEAWVRAQFPAYTLDGRFWIARTRDNLPDYLPNDPAADDTFAMMADRMIPLARWGVLAAGGAVDGETWTLPPVPTSNELRRNPAWREWKTSATQQTRARGGSVTPSCSVSPAPPPGRGIAAPYWFVNGLETDFTGAEEDDGSTPYFTTQANQPGPAQVSLTAEYSLPVTATGIRFFEGDHFHDAQSGGWFDSVTIQLRINGTWTPVTARAMNTLDPARPFQALTWTLPQPVTCTGVRLTGAPGGAMRFVTCAELDLIESPPAALPAGWDVNPDRVLSAEDLYEQARLTADVNGDGATTPADTTAVEAPVRMHERVELTDRQ